MPQFGQREDRCFFLACRFCQRQSSECVRRYGGNTVRFNAPNSEASCPVSLVVAEPVRWIFRLLLVTRWSSSCRKVDTPRDFFFFFFKWLHRLIPNSHRSIELIYSCRSSLACSPQKWLSAQRELVVKIFLFFFLHCLWLISIILIIKERRCHLKCHFWGLLCIDWAYFVFACADCVSRPTQMN